LGGDVDGCETKEMQEQNIKESSFGKKINKYELTTVASLVGND